MAKANDSIALFIVFFYLFIAFFSVFFNPVFGFDSDSNLNTNEFNIANETVSKINNSPGPITSFYNIVDMVWQTFKMVVKMATFQIQLADNDTIDGFLRFVIFTPFSISLIWILKDYGIKIVDMINPF